MRRMTAPHHLSPADEERVRDRSGACPHPVHFWEMDDGTEQVRALVLLPCNRLGCAVCGPALRRRFVGHYTRIFKALSDVLFLTLTLDPRCHCATNDAHVKGVVQRFLGRLRERCRYRGLELHYVLRFERHQDGRLHVHIVASLPLSDAAIRTCWFGSGGGAVCYVEPLSTARDVARVVGYLFKNVDAPDGAGHRTLASEGIGYYSEGARAERARRARERTPPSERLGPLISAYRARKREDASEGAGAATAREEASSGASPTPGGIFCADCPLRRWRTSTYIQRRRDGSIVRWTYDPATGEATALRLSPVHLLLLAGARLLQAGAFLILREEVTDRAPGRRRRPDRWQETLPHPGWVCYIRPVWPPLYARPPPDGERMWSAGCRLGVYATTVVAVDVRYRTQGPPGRGCPLLCYRDIRLLRAAWPEHHFSASSCASGSSDTVTLKEYVSTISPSAVVWRTWTE